MTQYPEKEYEGQFPSKKCHCSWMEPYGFCPEADCPEHDTREFLKFLEVHYVSRSKIERVLHNMKEMHSFTDEKIIIDDITRALVSE